MMRFAYLSTAAAGLLACATGVSAQATEHSQPPTAAVGVARKPALLQDDELASYRGGQALTIANQTLTSIVSDPSIGGSVSGGAVTLSDNALSNFNGLGNLVINTGSQVSVQSGMNVTVTVHQ